MIFRISMIPLMALMVWTCAQHASKDKAPFDTGLQIQNGPNQGLGCTDSLGVTYGLIYRTVTITNDSIVPIRFEIAVPDAYAHPVRDGVQRFEFYLWPGRSGPQVTRLDTLGNALENFVGEHGGTTHAIHKTLAPGEQYVMTMGTLYVIPPEVCSAVAYALFADRDEGMYPECDRPLNGSRSSDLQYPLSIMVGFCTTGNTYETCMIIPCGQITYPGR